MAGYVDGFVIPIPEKKLAEYRRIAGKSGKIWMEYGALAYYECVGDDLTPEGITATFPKIVKPKPGEMILFSWILYRSKAHRNSVMKKIMADPRMEQLMDPKDPPFDMKRMTVGGFKVLVGG
ncbi:MAG: DUF1428 domain-containing protein [Bacteroidetes bacterium]|nr:DUF1428 domain-containing protein [Bacteroidota bacterium]